MCNCNGGFNSWNTFNNGFNNGFNNWNNVNSLGWNGFNNFNGFNGFDNWNGNIPENINNTLFGNPTVYTIRICRRCRRRRCNC